jgi:hypothetical protein
MIGLAVNIGKTMCMEIAYHWSMMANEKTIIGNNSYIKTENL